MFYVELLTLARQIKNARSLSLPLQLSRKFSRILTIWKSGQGVVSLHVFHNTTAEEAFCREACMINTIGKIPIMQL